MIKPMAQALPTCTWQLLTFLLKFVTTWIPYLGNFGGIPKIQMVDTQLWRPGTNCAFVGVLEVLDSKRQRISKNLSLLSLHRW